MKGKRFISSVLAVMTFWLSSGVSALPVPVLALGDVNDEAAEFTLGTSLNDVVSIDEVNFPDSTFRNYVSKNFDTDKSGGLSQEELDAVTEINVAGDYGAIGNITNLKGIEYFSKLTKIECCCNRITSLDVSKNSALKTLSCYHNQLTNLDVSNNTDLEFLYCSENHIASLDLRNNTSLKELICSTNMLSSLDLTNNTKLQWLNCSHNSISEIDLTNNTELTFLNADDYTVLIGYERNKTALSISGFNGDSSKVKSESGNILSDGGEIYEGKYIYIEIHIKDYINHELYINGEKAEPYVTGDVYKYYYSCTAEGSSMSIELREEPWSAERMSGYTVLNADEGVRVYWYNKYTGYIVDFPNTIANGCFIPKGVQVCIRISSELYSNMPKMYINGQFQASTLNMDGDWQVWGRFVPYADEFRISVDGMASSEPVAEIDETTFPDPSFREIIKSQCDLNKDGYLSESEIYKVTYLDISGLDENPGNIESLKGIEYFTELVYLECYNNKISYLDVSGLPKLYLLSCGNNKLTSLDVSNNKNLGQFYCSDNLLTEIDVTNNRYLDRFACAGNQISSLDLRKNTSLTWLFCSANKLTTLDLSNNTKLETLGINENNLTSLDLSKNTKLTEYYDDDNSYEIALTGNSFDLSKLPAGFDHSKASNWNGAEYDSESNSLINFTSDTVTYDYDCGNGHSITFTLVKTGGNSMNITGQPADTAVIEGLDASLSVTAEGGDITYQWQKASGDSWVDISGETSSELTLKNVTYDMDGTKYRCVVTASGESETSAVAVLTVKAAEVVTASEVNAMSIDEAIGFVNAFTARYDQAGKDTAVLTEAQMIAIEKVLENDLKA